MSPKRLLYLAFFYPPSRASGVYRAIATSEVFSRAGWEVTVLAVDVPFLEDELGSADHSLMGNIPETVELHRIPFTFSRHVNFPFDTAGPATGYFPGLQFKLHQRKARSNGRFPDRYESWVEPVVQTATRLAAGGPFDHILATANPYAAMEAARLIAIDTATPYSVDYRDPWTFDPATGNDSLGEAEHHAEQRIVNSSRFVFHVNDVIAAAYSRKYPQSRGKHIVAMNGYDTDSLGMLHVPARQGGLQFGALGTITERWPLDSLGRGWLKATNQMPEGSHLEIAGHLGFFEQSQSVVSSYLPRDVEAFDYIGPIPKGQAGEFNQRLDVVVTPVPDGTMVTGSKIFEALAVGVPVVCIQGEGGGALALPHEHPYFFASPPDADAVADAFVQAAEAAQAMRDDEPGQIRAAMTRYERLNSLIPMLEAIQQDADTGDE